MMEVRTLPCVHLGAATGDARSCIRCGNKPAVPIYDCPLHGCCTGTLLLMTLDPSGKIQRYPRFQTCRDYRAGPAGRPELGRGV